MAPAADRKRLAGALLSRLREQGGAEAAAGSVAHALAWAGAAKWLSQLVSWLSMIVAARLLTPDDFGLVGMAQVFLTLVAMLSEFGLATAIIAQPKLSEEEAGQLNALALLLAAGAAVVAVAAALPLGRFFAEPRLPLVVGITSVGFLIAGFRAVPLALLQKELKFRYVALTEAAQATAMAATMVGLAALGFGYWALVLAPLVGNLVAAGLNVLGRPCRFSTPRLGALSDVLTDGRRLLASRLSWWVQTNADQVIIGRRLGGPALGTYSLAASIASLPVDKITALVSQVSPPFVAAARSDPRETRRLLFVLSGTLAVVALPVAAGIALVADEFVPLVLGAQWSEAVLPLQLLAALAAPRCVVSVLATVVLMTGGIRLSMVLSIIEAFLMTAVFYFASGYGVAGVAAGALLAYPLLRGPLIWLAFRRLDVDPAEYWSALWPGLRATALMVLAVLACESLLRPGTSELASLVAQVSIGVAAYALASLAGHRRLRGMLRDFRALGTR